MRAYSVTTVHDDDGWIGTEVYASKPEAMVSINQHIDELNEYSENKLHHLMWPERTPCMSNRVRSVVFHCATHNLEK